MFIHQFLSLPSEAHKSYSRLSKYLLLLVHLVNEHDLINTGDECDALWNDQILCMPSDYDDREWKN